MTRNQGRDGPPSRRFPDQRLPELAPLFMPALLRVETRIAAGRSVCMLAFGALFYLDRIVSPAPDEVTSTTATGASGQHGGAAFTTTHWSVVLEARGESPAAQEALEKLCRTYWRPIFAFLRRQGIGPTEAEDITQGFFAQLLERKSFDAVRKEKGRLRSYLLGALKYFVTDEQRRAMAIKRGKGQRLISLEDTANVGGNIIQRGTAGNPIVGTYTVNPDGTGTMQWFSNGSNHARVFAIVDGCKELQLASAEGLSIGPGVVGRSGVAKKQ